MYRIIANIVIYNIIFITFITEILVKLIICFVFLCVFPIIGILYPLIKNMDFPIIGFIYKYGTDFKRFKLVNNIIKIYT